MIVCGCRVQVDRSGVGRCWVDADEDSLPADIRGEIEAEIIDGGAARCERYVARNGLLYRWS